MSHTLIFAGMVAATAFTAIIPFAPEAAFEAIGFALALGVPVSLYALGLALVARARRNRGRPQ